MAKSTSVGKRPGRLGIGTCFYNHVPGWPGSGFEWQETEITVDRLDHEGRDELRLSIAIRTKTAKRVREELSYMTLPDGHALAFLDACNTRRKLKAA